MISIYNTSFVSTDKLSGPSVVSVCPLGFSRSELDITALPVGSIAGRDVLSGVPVRVCDERPSKALDAGAAAAQAQAYAFAAVSADSTQKQMNQHHTMWAFRGPEPWRDPA